METRTLGRTGLAVGVIGLGTEQMAIEAANMDAVIDLGVSGGVSYIDLFSDPSAGPFAEYLEAIGPAIRRHRERLTLCLHWGHMYHEPLDRCQRGFDHALARVADGHAEVAMLTMVDTAQLWSGWAQEALERLQEYRRDGRVGFVGISSHSAPVSRAAVESGLIDVLMFSMNLYQHPLNPERAELLRTCATHDVGVVAMKPYYGGRLLRTDGHPTGITPGQCLRYVLDQGAAVAVPGVRDVDEMRDALASAHAPRGIEAALLPADLMERLRGQCVHCRHCLPCPQGIDISAVIDSLEKVEFYAGSDIVRQFCRQQYAGFKANASDCVECGVCLERCAFDVDIIAKMRRAVEVFEVSV